MSKFVEESGHSLTSIEETRFGVQLLGCMLTMQQNGEARRILNDIRSRKKTYAAKAREELTSMAEASINREDMGEEELTREERV